jgi:hypothetical protein
MFPTDRTRTAVRAFALILTLGCGAAFGDAPPSPFVAEMEFLRNGKPIGEATFSLEVDGNDWVMRSSVEGTRGVARFLGVEESSESRGDWVDGGPRPKAFVQRVKVSFKTIETRANFDWAAGQVLSIHKDGENVLETEPGLMDPVSVGLAIRKGLENGEREWRLPMVDEDEIEEQHFRAEGAEALDTPLGCLETERVDKIRRAGSTRYTQTWYARDLDWVPVYVAHGKTDGDRMESRLVSLTVDGKPVPVSAPCGG